MITIETTGLTETIERLKKQSARIRDLTPAYKVIAAEYVKKTDDAFHNSKGYDGEAWEPLSQVTIDNRVGSLKAANKRGKTGKLTKGAQALRSKLTAPGGIKPLIDTARARNSVHAAVSKEGIEWSAVGYLGVHMGGTDRAGKSRNVTIPMRNPTPFEWTGSEWKLRKSALDTLGNGIRKYIFAETRT